MGKVDGWVPAADRAVFGVKDEKGRSGFTILRNHKVRAGVRHDAGRARRAKRLDSSGRNGHHQWNGGAPRPVKARQSRALISDPERAVLEEGESPTIDQIGVLVQGPSPDVRNQVE